ncbi:MAG TPA: amidohydrolase family protein [Motilibacterales bacterium]|nr:amidohydrolase family protein [Motilibacterales bacterium]
MAAEHPFDVAYRQGLTTTFRRPEVASRPRPGGAPAHPPGWTTAQPTEPYALGGTVITPTGSLARGWVLVEGSTIVEVRSTRPSGVQSIATDGVILPGLIDLHGHPEYNVFPAWEPPRLYTNRMQWRDSPAYAALIKEPWALLTKDGTSPSLKASMARYAETRAAVGGVTAIQGASKHYPKSHEALVRNVDLYVFGEQVARNTIDFGRLDGADIANLSKAISEGRIRAHYVHLAEGLPTHAPSVREFEDFAASGLLGPATAVIHGTALSRGHFDQMAAVGASLVWSPQSNLRLYGATTDLAAALAAGVDIALGADWLPSGSQSLLHEVKVAGRALAAQGVTVPSADLVGWMTSGAARIAGFADRLGSLHPGGPADIVVLARRADDPYDSVVAAYPSDVELVMIGGDIVFGRPDWCGALTDSTEYEAVLAWGRRMLLDTRFGAPVPAAATPGPTSIDPDPSAPPLRLAAMRERLVRRHPGIGPIFG